MWRTLTLLLLLNVTFSARSVDDPLAAIDELLQREPNHQGARYYAARVAARRGELERAMHYLQQLHALGFDDALELNDFPALSNNTDFQQLAQQLQKNAPAIGKVTLFAETQCSHLLPEGTAYDARREELLISSGHQRSVFAVKADGQCRNIIRDNTGLLAVLGMQVDAAHDRLWVANTHAPFMKNSDDSTAGKAQLSLIDLSNGRVIQHYPLPVKGLANDLTLLSNGDVLLTESMGGAIYRWVAAKQTIEVAWPNGSFEGPNGIVAMANDDVIVADFHGLWLLPAQHPMPSIKFKLQLAEPRYFGGMDGLARRGDTVIAIQNLIGRGRIWSFKVDAANQRITDLQLQLRNHPDLLNPTTGAVHNDRFLFVADPDLQQNNTATPKPLPPGRRGHRILSVAL